ATSLFPSCPSCHRRWAAGRSGMAKTVMIVEDNELNMKLFHDLLEAHGYQTVGTRNGIEALDLARKHRPDLILMDIQSRCICPMLDDFLLSNRRRPHQTRMT